MGRQNQVAWLRIQQTSKLFGLVWGAWPPGPPWIRHWHTDGRTDRHPAIA